MNDQKIKTTTIIAEMCECGRLYKDRKNHKNELICSCCYTGLNIDELKKLWGTPINLHQ